MTVPGLRFRLQSYLVCVPSGQCGISSSASGGLECPTATTETDIHYQLVMGFVACKWVVKILKFLAFVAEGRWGWIWAWIAANVSGARACAQTLGRIKKWHCHHRILRMSASGRGESMSVFLSMDQCSCLPIVSALWCRTWEPRSDRQGLLSISPGKVAPLKLPRIPHVGARAHSLAGGRRLFPPRQPSTRSKITSSTRQSRHSKTFVR